MTETTPNPVTIYERFRNLKSIEDRGLMPQHVAIIMDGNRHWAREKFGEDAKPIQGHAQGMENIVGILRDLREIRAIRYITLWAFSPENWQRDPEEVSALMDLFAKAIPATLPEVKADNGRFVHLGRKDRITPQVRQALAAAESETAGNTGQTVCLAIDYGSEDQEVRVMQRLVDLGLAKGTLVTPAMLKDLRDTHLNDGTDIPPIDLVFRTSGQQRLSGLPNAEYAEFYPITSTLPSATTADFVKGLSVYAQTDRRFGGNSTK